MTVCKLIKDLSTKPDTVLDVMSKFLFGEEPVTEYNSTNIYNENDIIFRYENNEMKLYKCTNINVTGEFNPDDWISLKIDTAGKTIMISSTIPAISDNNSMWFQPIKEENIEIPSIT